MDRNPIVFRDYQQAAIDATWNYFREKKGNPIIGLPTGTGKSLVNAGLIKSMIDAYSDTRVLSLTHVKELIDNNSRAMTKVMPTASMGIFSAGLKRKDLNCQITFGGIASIYKRAAAFKNTDIVTIDECHLISPNDNTRYGTFLGALKDYNPHLKVIGLTATAFRLGLGHLTDGTLFDDMCFDLTSGEAFIWMIQQGYLAPLVPRETDNQLDRDGLRIVGGEFRAKDVNDAFDDMGMVKLAVEEALDLAANRRSWLVFAPSIDHAEQIAGLLERYNIKASFVHSKLKGNEERDHRLLQFKNLEIQAMVNRDILTTGFDHPALDCILMLRPTQSPGLWVQMLGRGTRPLFAEGFDLTTAAGRLQAIAASPKQNCLVLDYVGNTLAMGPINYPTIPKRKGKGGGDPPARTCPECAYIQHISIPECECCGYVFPKQEKTHQTASGADLILDLNAKPAFVPEYGVFEVGRMSVQRHQKAGKPDSARVDYYAGVRRFTQYVGFEHSGFMKKKARDWWMMHCKVKGAEAPETTDDFLDNFDSDVRAPRHIRVLLNKRYPEIVDYDFTGRAFQIDNNQLDLDHGGRTDSAADEDSGPDRSEPTVSQLSDLHEFQ